MTNLSNGSRSPNVVNDCQIIKWINIPRRRVWGNQSSGTKPLVRRHLVWLKFSGRTCSPDDETVSLKKNLFVLFTLVWEVYQEGFQKRSRNLKIVQSLWSRVYKHWNDNMHDSIHQQVPLVITSVSTLNHNFIFSYLKGQFWIIFVEIKALPLLKIETLTQSTLVSTTENSIFANFTD